MMIKEIKIGLLGLGTVGTGIAKLIYENGGYLYKLNLQTGQAEKLKISINTKKRTEVKPYFLFMV